MRADAIRSVQHGSGREIRQNRLRAWRSLHQWSSLICTAFLLLVCVSGLPLIFEDEIEHWLGPAPTYVKLPADAPRASLDRLASEAHQVHPGYIILSVFVDDDEPQVVIGMAPSWKIFEEDRSSVHTVRFDARTGQVLERPEQSNAQHITFMDVVFRLHTDLFAGLPGEMFMGAMGLLFVIAIVSGVALYGPFTRKLDFGEVRVRRSRRVHWLDLHNVLGIVTLGWALIVGATGVMNELSTPLFDLWQNTDLDTAVAPWKGKEPPRQNELSSIQAAFDTAQHALPGMTVVSASYPGGGLASPYHYLLFTKGKTHLTSQLFSPVLVDARTGKLTAVVRMPWYLRALEISRPLHFGNYGGLPLKIIWALLDLVTIVVLGSGLYLWIGKRKRSSAEIVQERHAFRASGELLEAAE